MVNSRDPRFLELLIIAPAWILSSRPEGQLASAPTAGTHEIFFDVKEIETDLSLALRMTLRTQKAYLSFD